MLFIDVRSVSGSDVLLTNPAGVSEKGIIDTRRRYLFMETRIDTPCRYIFMEKGIIDTRRRYLSMEMRIDTPCRYLFMVKGDYCYSPQISIYGKRDELYSPQISIYGYSCLHQQIGRQGCPHACPLIRQAYSYGLYSHGLL